MHHKEWKWKKKVVESSHKKLRLGPNFIIFSAFKTYFLLWNTDDDLIIYFFGPHNESQWGPMLFWTALTFTV